MKPRDWIWFAVWMKIVRTVVLSAVSLECMLDVSDETNVNVGRCRC